jgi:hypothetical protein
MQLLPYQWHQWRYAEPAKKAKEKGKPGNMKGAHLYALTRKNVQLCQRLIHVTKIKSVIKIYFITPTPDGEEFLVLGF